MVWAAALGQCAVDGGVAELHPWRNQKVVGSIRHGVVLTIARLRSGRSPSMLAFRRREILGFIACAFAAPVPALAQSKEPVLIGVTGPLTGQYAQYGAQWKKGFDVALDEINAAGGINGRPLAYVFEDSQSDPRQTATIPRKHAG